MFMMVWIIYSMLIAAIAVAFYTDIRTKKIPNRLTLSMIICGLLMNMANNQWQGLAFAIFGVLIALAVMLLLYTCGGLGAGDVKLFAGIGALMGAEFALVGLFYSLLFAAAIGIVIAVFRGDLWNRLTGIIRRIFFTILWRDPRQLHYAQREGTLQFPFMIAVAPGLLTYGLILGVG